MVGRTLLLVEPESVLSTYVKTPFLIVDVTVGICNPLFDHLENMIYCLEISMLFVLETP